MSLCSHFRKNCDFALKLISKIPSLLLKTIYKKVGFLKVSHGERHQHKTGQVEHQYDILDKQVIYEI